MTRQHSPDEVLAGLRAHLAEHDPDLNRWAVEAAARAFLEGRSGALEVPDQSEARDYLEALIGQHGPEQAHRDYSFLLMAAAHLWGRQESAHLSPVLREARTTPKAVRKTEWERAAQAIAQLPEEWQPAFHDHLVRSREGGVSLQAIEPWSASHLQTVARALGAWARYCQETKRDPRPTGAAFDAYALWLQESDDKDVSDRSIANYLSRILSGFSVLLEPHVSYEGARWVAEDWAQRAAGQGPATKSAAQVLPASTLYDLGFELMAEARGARYYGLGAARLFRNGLLLSVAVSLPQRARALAALDLASTFRLMDRPLIQVRLPGRVLKMRQRLKATNPYQAPLRSPRLWEAVDEYRRVFRPLFDDGTALFPSVHARGRSISERRLGVLIGNITKTRLGVRVPIHRVRDCVATEASEELVHGGRLAPRLLGHRDETSSNRHYDHAEGLRAAEALEARVRARQAHRPGLQVGDDCRSPPFTATSADPC